jgi:hypothetical protein
LARSLNLSLTGRGLLTRDVFTRALLTAGALRRSFMVTTALLLGQRIRRTGSQPCKEAQ